MMQSDLQLMTKGMYLQEGGYTTKNKEYKKLS